MEALFMQAIGHLLRSLYDLVTNYLVKAHEIRRLWMVILKYLTQLETYVFLLEINKYIYICTYICIYE